MRFNMQKFVNFKKIVTMVHSLWHFWTKLQNISKGYEK